MSTWWLNNTGFLVGASRVAAVDACSTEARTRALRAAGADAGQHPPSRRPHPRQLPVRRHDDHRARAEPAEILAEGPPGTSKLVNSGTWTDVE
jgi:cyclase